MQIEFTLHGSKDGPVSGRDLGHLLHKHPDNVFERESPYGKVFVVFPEATDERTRALLYVDVDPVGLVRTAGRQAHALLQTYVNDRPYACTSFLTTAMSKAFGKTMAGVCDRRQDLADAAIDLEIRIRPIWALESEVRRFLEPLGYEVEVERLAKNSDYRTLVDVRLKIKARIADVMRHLYVIIPALDGWKHVFLDEKEIANVLAKGEGWLADHPARSAIVMGNFRRVRSLGIEAIRQLEAAHPKEGDAFVDVMEAEVATGTPHEQRHAIVVDEILKSGARSVVDLGCGEGRLLSRLIREQQFDRILGVEVDSRELADAAKRIKLDTATPGMKERISLLQGSLVYGDDRWAGFDAAALVEVIEHFEPSKLDFLVKSVFVRARPRTVVVTTPNVEFNEFMNMDPTQLRHSDHRFEWTRAEFKAWADAVGERHGYEVRIEQIVAVDETYGGLSQMAVMTRKGPN